MSEGFVKNRIKSIQYAFKGAWLLLKSEASIQVQCTVGILMTILGIIVQINPTEWMFQTLAIGLVLAIEGLNTALEKLADFIHPDYHSKIGFIKDIAAGAVCFAALAALVIGGVIYIPYLLGN